MLRQFLLFGFIQERVRKSKIYSVNEINGGHKLCVGYFPPRLGTLNSISRPTQTIQEQARGTKKNKSFHKRLNDR